VGEGSPTTVSPVVKMAVTPIMGSIPTTPIRDFRAAAGVPRVPVRGYRIPVVRSIRVGVGAAAASVRLIPVMAGAAASVPVMAFRIPVVRSIRVGVGAVDRAAKLGSFLCGRLAPSMGFRPFPVSRFPRLTRLRVRSGLRLESRVRVCPPASSPARCWSSS
jgi:hypothetical protein